MTSVSSLSRSPAASGHAEGVMGGVRTRPAWLPVPFAAVTFIGAISMLAGGQQVLTDVAWLLLTLCCAWCLLLELRAFRQRFGVGGIVFFGGVLIWFCLDYLSHWFRGPTANEHFAGTGGLAIDTALLAEASFYHFLFITFVTVGLAIDWGALGARFMAKTPQPSSRSALIMIGTILGAVGLSTYAFFTVEPFHVALWKDFWSMRSGDGPTWTIGRSGLLNYNWGGYIGQLWDVGRFGGLICVFCAIYIARSRPAKLWCWFIWGIWFMLAFGSGTRSQTAVMGLPPLAMLFIKHHAEIAMYLRRGRFRPYLVAGGVAAALFIITQVQGYIRTQGLTGLQNLDAGQVATARDNTMFSHTLWVFGNYPEQYPFVANSIPGEGAVRAIPQTLFYAVVGIIPRALWPGKPVDPLWATSTLERGGGTLMQSTTVSTGLVGSWYARFGVAGVIEGALFWSWMLLAFEKLLYFSGRKPILIVLSLAGMAFMFRTFRDMNWHSFYPIVIGMAGLLLLSSFTRRQRAT